MTSNDSHDKTKNLVNTIFGSQHRTLREHAGVSVAQLAAAVGYSDDQVRKIESGKRRAQDDYIAATDAFLGANGVLVATAAKLRESQLIPDWFADYVETEAVARRIDEYDVQSVPGLLQTTEYARVVLSDYHPTLDDEEVDRRAQHRMDRQVLLSRKPRCMLSFVIEEAALRRPLGGRAVMRRQLQHLLDCARMRNITMQVMPLDCETHTGLNGPFTLLETGDRKRVVYVEHQGGMKWLSDPDQVSTMEGRVWDHPKSSPQPRGLVESDSEVGRDLWTLRGPPRAATTSPGSSLVTAATRVSASKWLWSGGSPVTAANRVGSALRWRSARGWFMCGIPRLLLVLSFGSAPRAGLRSSVSLGQPVLAFEVGRRA